MTVTPPPLGRRPTRGVVDERVVRELSASRGEPTWLLDRRLVALGCFQEQQAPTWGVDLSGVSFAGETIQTLGRPSTSQSEAELGFQRQHDLLSAQGVLFADMNTAVRDYPDLIKAHLGTIVPPDVNQFCALNTALWSGGTFVYVPPGITVDVPLQAYARVRAERVSPFERTLILADEGSTVSFIDGCSAPIYTPDSLRTAVVEVVVKPAARVTYTTIQNWSSNVYNPVTKRALVQAEGHMEWVDGSFGSRLTMQRPAVVLAGRKASGAALSVAFAGPGQHHDTGARMVHVASETTSTILAKSISQSGGRSSYRGLVQVQPDALGCTSQVQTDALVLDGASASDTYPIIEVGSSDAVVSHVETASKVTADQLFYLMSRGLSQEQAVATVVNGFIEPVARTLPIEFAVEWSRLIEMDVAGSVG